MLWIYLIILQIVFFAGLLYFLRFVLTRNISRATGHLHELSKEYASKEEEGHKILQDAKKESKNIVAKETQVAQEAKEKLIKESQEQSEQILRSANQKSIEITEKAQRNADFVRKELDLKIDERAKEKVTDLLKQSIPQKFLKDIHQLWIEESEKGPFDLKHLKLPEKVTEAKIVSAFPLTDQQQKELKEKINKKVGTDVALKTEVDSSLLTGFVIMIGSVVVDASLKYKIENAMKE